MDPTFETETGERLTAEDLREAWPVLDAEERMDGFRLLSRESAENFFLQLSSHGQAIVLRGVPLGERRGWLRLLAPDDVADVMPQLPEEERGEYLQLLDDSTRREVSALLA